MACATCGDACAYPHDIQRANDGRYRCTKNGCYEEITVQDDNRLRSQVRHEDRQPMIPGALVPTGRL
jgi:hypothetical protein